MCSSYLVILKEPGVEDIHLSISNFLFFFPFCIEMISSQLFVIRITDIHPMTEQQFIVPSLLHEGGLNIE